MLKDFQPPKHFAKRKPCIHTSIASPLYTLVKPPGSLKPETSQTLKTLPNTRPGAQSRPCLPFCEYKVNMLGNHNHTCASETAPSCCLPLAVGAFRARCAKQAEFFPSSQRFHSSSCVPVIDDDRAAPTQKPPRILS